ncbi:MAG: hypothetical protein IH988_03640 [Planctomycetes bacterium]|nr:hypothetical protein [Planctomycetota bacterium]
MSEPNRPIKVIRLGSVNASIWRNESKKGGRTTTWHSVRVCRSYREKETDDWKETEYFNPGDLLNLEHVTRRAFEFIDALENEETPA